MNKLHELKEKLMDELTEYSRKEDLSAGDIEVIDKLAHTVKNLCKIIEESKENYSGMTYPMYSRARDGRRRESRQYSMADKLQDLANEADPRTRQEIERLIDRM
jgi:hypothetical protein